MSAATDRGALLALAAMVFCFYLITFSGRFHAIDEISTLATTESLVKHGDLAVEQVRWSASWTPPQNREGADGRYYSKKGVGIAVLAAPLYALALRWPGLGLVQSAMITGAILTAGSVLLLAAVLRRLGYGLRPSLAVAAIFALATPAWPYSRTLYAEPPTTFLWLLALWALLASRDAPAWAALAGAALGASVLVKTPNLVGVAVFVVACFFRQMLPSITPLPLLGRGWGRGPALVVPLLFFAALFLGLSWLRFGSPLASGYGDGEERFVFDYATSLPALLFSPGKGLLVFAPPLLVALAGWRRFWRRQRDVALLAVALTLATLLLYGAWFMWWGGWSWGPRFLLPLVPWLLLPLAEVLTHPTRLAVMATALSAAIGAAINFLGAVVDFNEYLAALLERGIDDRAIVWSPALWPPAGHLALLRAGTVDLAWLAPGLAWVPLLLGGLAIASLLMLLPGHRPATRHLRQSRLATLVAVGALVTVLLALPKTVAGAEDEALRQLSQTIAANAGAGDVVLVDLVPYQNYFGFIRRWMNHYKAPPPYTALVRGEADERAWQRLAGYRRLWLVLPQTGPADPASSTERWWAERAAFLDERWVGEVRLVRFVRAPGGQCCRWASGAGLGPAHVLGESVELLAPGVVPDDRLVLVTLPWRALRPLDRELRVFVQLLGSDGRVVSQQDRAPVSGFAPTTAWQPGAVVVDRYALPLPADGGSLRLITGLYDPATGARLPAADGTDFVDLGEIRPE